MLKRLMKKAPTRVHRGLGLRSLKSATDAQARSADKRSGRGSPGRVRTFCMAEVAIGVNDFDARWFPFFALRA